MNAPANRPSIGRWRIVEADIRDHGHLDLCGTATITIADDNHGEIAFGAMQTTLKAKHDTSSTGSWIADRSLFPLDFSLAASMNRDAGHEGVQRPGNSVPGFRW